MFETFSENAGKLNLQIEYINDEDIVSGKADLSSLDAVFLQHSRPDARDKYTVLLKSARAKNSKFRAYPCSGDGSWVALVPEMAKDGTFVNDEELKKYYNSNKENLRRFLIYALVKYCGRDMKIEPPADPGAPLVYHPDKPDGFPDIRSFLEWSSAKRDISKSGRVIVVAHSNHLMFQQPKVVDALIREFEKRGILAVCLTDGNNGYEQRELEFKPGLVIHTCHGGESVDARKKLDVPHISSLYNKGQSIDEYLDPANMLGLNSGRAHQIITQECMGGTQPLFVSATIKGGGSEEALTPVPERVEHLVDRSCALLKLRNSQPDSRKVAIIYYDRDMGKTELMRGTPTGMNMNAPRSMVEVLKRLSAEGYGVKDAPMNEDELLSMMKDHGRQVGVWNPAVLDKLARSGKAILIPEETYMKWYEEKVPEVRRREIEHQWGPPPGKFLVWEKEGRKFIVIPRLDMGNVVLLPQPLRGEAQSATSLAAQTHDKLIPPPHNYLATYFWLQEGFPADAIIHFGTHGSEFFLPGKADALVRSDWCDIILGRLPNIGVWIINNLGESVPAKRRTYSTIVDHLTPPLVEAELSDDLKNLQSDIEKWTRVEEGALKDKFAKSIGEQVVKLDLAKDLKLDFSGRLPTEKEISTVETHLETIANESVPISLHVFGQVPSKEQLIPYYVRCAGKKFLDAIGMMLPKGEGLDREMDVRKKAESAIRLVVERKLPPEETLKSVGAAIPADGVPKIVAESFAMLVQLDSDMKETGNEFSGLLAALGGRFVPPGPGNSPDRNPGSVPTGRNMFVVNPEEIPSPQSWEIGKQLVDDLLKSEFEKNGRYPNKVAFSLGPMSTYRDFGVIESQILYLMGVRPVWDAKRLVGSVELIPAKELGRPRVDVFIQLRGLYRDQLPTRMQLIDKAIRLISDIDEPGNTLRKNTLKVKNELVQSGMEPSKAEYSSVARMFGMPPGQAGSSWYYYLVQKTGEWNSREDLMRTYLEHSRSLYTENHWGEEAPEAYKQAIQGAEIVIRSWADSVSSPLSNKYTWYIDGSLSMAIKHLTGREPKYYFADVRDPSGVKMITAEDAINTDFHVRLFNRKWIEGMMKEGYAGADQVKTNVSNMLGWKIMREDSIRDDQWNEVVEVYVRDSRKLHVREWFDKENPHAFQTLVHMMMEAARKEYWKADEATLKELASEYAKSVVKYGPDGGIRTGGNSFFEKFLSDKLSTPGDAKLLADYKATMEKETAVQNQQTGAPASNQLQPAPGAVKKTEQNPSQVQEKPKAEQVKGKELAHVHEQKENSLFEKIASMKNLIIVGLIGVLVFYLGFCTRKGMPGK
ncbi:MAG: hypothetical protein A2X45_01285 [Lentisphaerae bacterium GWF2_50_93]|nr:MAG: hypothetical protein A2X45_01285 [Lentisphaerae bacterium GWF2_50_93]